MTFDDVLARLLAALGGETDPDAIWSAMAAAMGWFGPGFVAYGVLAQEPVSLVQHRGDLPAGLVEALLARDAMHNDYIMLHAMTAAAPALFRPGGEEPTAMPPERRATFDAVLTEFGVGAVIVVPFHGLFYAAGLAIFLREPPAGDAATALMRAATLASVFRAHYDPGVDPKARPVGAVTARYGALTAREREALTLCAQGLLTARIAERMGISEAGAKKHLSAARRKLGARTREEAVARAARLGLLPSVRVAEDGWTPVFAEAEMGADVRAADIRAARGRVAGGGDRAE